MKLTNRHVFIVGRSGSGKSTAEVKDLVEEAKRGHSAIVCIDPHPNSLAAQFFAHLCEEGLQDRVLYDRLRDLDRVLRWDFLTPSRAKHKRERRGENQARCERFAEILLRRRGQASARDTPNIEKWLLAALNLYIYQHKRRPLADIRYAFSFEHPKFQAMLAGCSDDDTRRMFEEAIDRGQREHEAAGKIIDGSLRSEAFQVRTEHTGGFHFERHLNNKGIVIIEGEVGGSLSEDAMITMMGAVILKTLSFLEERKREYPEVILSLDEATNYNLVGEAGHEIKALATHRKFGLAMHILVQLLDFPAKMQKGVMTNCATRKYFLAGDPPTAARLGADLGGSYTTSGRKTRYYKDGSMWDAPIDIDNPYAHEILNLRIGECFVKRDSEKEKVQITPLPKPFRCSAKELAPVVDGYLNKIKQRPEYYAPDEEDEQPADDSPAPATDKPELPDDDDDPLGIF